MLPLQKKDMDYRRYDISPTIIAFVFKKADIKNKTLSEQIEGLLPPGNKKLVIGATYIELNGYKPVVKHIPLDKQTEKMIICVLESPQQPQGTNYSSPITDTQ